jgi:hypothetical protein
VILEQVAVAGRSLGQKGHGVFRVVVLREDHDGSARIAPPDLLGRVDTFALKGGGHADVGHQHVGFGCVRTCDYPVIVGGDAYDSHVRVTFDEGLHAGADDQVVVGEEYVDGACP